jgi:prepilin-type processing-associated H-X9-DG protein
MSRRVVVVVAVVLMLVLVAALAVPYILKVRLNANLAGSQNNLRELSLFAFHHANPDPKRDAGKLPNEIPAATIVLPNTPPDDRLSWFVGVLPGLDQRRVNSEQLLARIDTSKPWSAEVNRQAARTRIPVLLCPENTPDVPPDAPAVTCYVGVSGAGANAATLPPTDPRAGAFRYDAPTPFDRVTDGLGQTLLMGEWGSNVGPWLRGGPSTVRGLDDAPGAAPLVGGQFGGYFPNGANFALCDGSVRTFTPRTTPGVLIGLATIGGKEADPLPGE